MGSYYDRWLEREMAWIREETKQSRKKTLLYIGIVIVVLPIISMVSALASGAPDFWKNVPISLLVGIVIGFFTWLGVNCSNPVKRYGKSIGREMKDSLSQTEQENFARQMLGEEPGVEVREVAWKSMMAGNNIAHVTRDYLTFAGIQGYFRLIPLWKTERIELDCQDSSYRVRTGNISMRVSDETYPMYFYYKGSQKAAKGEYDDSYTFEKREWRENVMRAINELTEE